MLVATQPVISALAVSDREDLASFFEALSADVEAVRFFHPHPLTAAHARVLCAGIGLRKDRYYVARLGEQIVGYSMLRGWDAGFPVPSFGVAVAREARGCGLGHLLLEHAVAECRRLAAPALRLTVYQANERAIHIYRKFGFVFTRKNAEEWIGVLNLQNG